MKTGNGGKSLPLLLPRFLFLSSFFYLLPPSTTLGSTDGDPNPDPKIPISQSPIPGSLYPNPEIPISESPFPRYLYPNPEICISL